jgi:hypothetical protein
MWHPRFQCQYLNCICDVTVWLFFRRLRKGGILSLDWELPIFQSCQSWCWGNTDALMLNGLSPNILTYWFSRHWLINTWLLRWEWLSILVAMPWDLRNMLINWTKMLSTTSVDTIQLSSHQNNCSDLRFHYAIKNSISMFLSLNLFCETWCTCMHPFRVLGHKSISFDVWQAVSSKQISSISSRPTSSMPILPSQESQGVVLARKLLGNLMGIY